MKRLFDLKSYFHIVPALTYSLYFIVLYGAKMVEIRIEIFKKGAGMYTYGMHGWGMFFGWLIPIGLLLMLVYFFNEKRGSSAKDILDRRYAKGEIDTKEYRERLKELSSLNDDNSD